MGHKAGKAGNEGKKQPRGKPFGKGNTANNPLTRRAWKPTDETEECPIDGQQHYKHRGPSLGD